MNLDELTENGHILKVYDRNRCIPDNVFDKLLKFIYYIPTSINAQCTHYIIPSSPESRSRIADHMGDGFEFNVPTVRDASHVIAYVD